MSEKLALDLQPKLSPDASITDKTPSRWSTYDAPKSIATVKVASENDVAVTVQYCNDHNLSFLAQNGGNGWAAFPKTHNLVIIDLSRLNTVTVAEDKTTAVIGGGAKVHGTISAADAAGVLVLTGNCNSVGTLGAILGGGYGNLLGQFGFGVDNILELRVVTADGEHRTISASQEKDLFWAMRGAGPNFGIVTAATVKAYPMSQNERSAWCGALIYSDDKLEQVVEAIQNLDLTADMVVFMYFASAGPPDHAPVVIVTPWLFQGNPDKGREAFQSLYGIGPMVENTANTGANPFGAHSERKPAFGAGLDHLDGGAWREVWNKFSDFQKKPSAHASAVILEAYPLVDKRYAGEQDVSFPHRSVRFMSAILPWYTDECLDTEAATLGQDVRELWRNNGGGRKPASYINFAHGDESLEEVYGASLPRLQELKRRWDPENRFGQWFSLH
ncbi:FAD binding domain-containing protein [Paraphoma chrysanthemicola]|uniref:FAD binding domain-containing protein n=1 Tax=Paraphoma chrysanthemicola TaxID=798071 RepID=A0A8K0R7M7_9PLEO|nr:FAD binding domain-containing protein [Paraphoma chrysanthemicola]